MRYASLAIVLLTSTSVIAFASHDALAAKTKSNHSFSGGVEVGVSTDRNAGSGGGSLRRTSSAQDDDEDEDDEDEDEDEDAFGDDDDIGDDVLDDLDLEDDDFADDVDDAEDEADGEADLDGDGIIDGTEDDVEADADAFELRRLGRAAARPKTVRDERLTTKLNAGHKYKFGSAGHAWKSGISYVNANQRDLDKNDNYIFALGTGPEFKLLKGDLTLNPSVAYARLNKDSKHIFDTYATSFGAKYKINKIFSVKGKYTYSMQNFESSKLDNVYGQKWAAALGIKPYKNGTAEIGAAFKTVDTSPAAKEKDQREIKAKYQHDFPMKFYAVGEAGYKWTDYDVAASTRVPVREDEEYTLGLSIGKEIYEKITLELQYDHRDVETNIINKDTSNDRFALVGAWKF